MLKDEPRILEEKVFRGVAVGHSNRPQQICVMHTKKESPKAGCALGLSTFNSMDQRSGLIPIVIWLVGAFDGDTHVFGLSRSQLG